MNIDSLKNDLNNLYLESVNDCEQDINDLKKKLYSNIISKLISDIVLLSNDKDIIDYSDKLYEEIREYKKTYDELYSLYNNDGNDKKDLANRISYLSYKIKAYYNATNVINKYTKVLKDSKMIKESRRIINLLTKSNNLKEKSNEAIETNNKIYEIRENRKNRLSNTLGFNGVKKLFEIESLEDKISMTNNLDKKEYILNSSSYISELKKTINSINAYLFNNLTNEKNAYYKYLYKYKDLIYSVFNEEEIVIPNYGITTSDLISYLSICNLNGGYKKYKAKYSDSMVGGEKVSSKNYQDYLNYLNGIINTLCDYINKKIGNKEITITPRDYQGIFYTELNNKLLSLEESILNKGEENVLR